MEINHKSIASKKTRLSRRSIVGAIVIVPLVVSFIMNVAWSATHVGWLYWGSRFLFSLEQVAIGISLIFFPNTLLQIWTGSKIDGNKIEERVGRLLVAALVMFLGGYLLITGVDDLSMLTRRWIAECPNATDCLRLYGQR